MLTSPQTAVHVVTLLEEMPVQETVDAVAELRAAGCRRGRRHQPGARPAAAGRGELASAAKGADQPAKVRGRPARRPGCGRPDALVDGLLAEAHDHALRVAQETEQLALLDQLERPMFRLPVNPDGVDASTVRELADLLAERGWTGEVTG